MENRFVGAQVRNGERKGSGVTIREEQREIFAAMDQVCIPTAVVVT